MTEIKYLFKEYKNLVHEYLWNAQIEEPVNDIGDKLISLEDIILDLLRQEEEFEEYYQ